jgi:hypothetical protein
LILSADEINALITTDPDFSALKGKFGHARAIGGRAIEHSMESVSLQLFRADILMARNFQCLVAQWTDSTQRVEFKSKDRPVPEVIWNRFESRIWRKVSTIPEPPPRWIGSK